MIAGAGEMALAIIDEFQKQGINPADVDQAVAAFGTAAIWCDNWYKSIVPAQRPGVMFILGGYRPGPAGAEQLRASTRRQLPNDGGGAPICRILVTSVLRPGHIVRQCCCAG